MSTILCRGCKSCAGPFQHGVALQLSEGHIVRSWAELSVLKVGQERKNANYFDDHRPIFEYLRHVRNAMAHGKAFHFQGKDPVRHSASFRSHHIDTGMEGKDCVSGELKVGEVFVLLEDVSEVLRTLS